MINISIYQENVEKTAVSRKAEAEYVKRLSRTARIRFRSLREAPENSIWIHRSGSSLDSPALAALFSTRLTQGNELHLAFAPAPDPEAASVQLLSLPLSPATDSVLLLEQIYRAFRILSGETYHK